MSDLIRRPCRFDSCRAELVFAQGQTSLIPLQEIRGVYVVENGVAVLCDVPGARPLYTNHHSTCPAFLEQQRRKRINRARREEEEARHVRR